MYSFSRIDTDPIGTTPQQSFTNYMTSLYAHINGAEDAELATRAKRSFGDIPAYTKEQDLYIGRAIVSNAGYTGDPFSYLRNNNRPIPENTLTEYELYHHIGKEFASQSRAEFAKAKATAVETRKQQEKALINGLKTIPAILAEHRLPTAKEMAELTNAGLGDRLHKAFTDTLEALDTINTFNTVTQEDIDAEVLKLKSKERQDYINNNKFAGLTGEIEYKPRHDDAWYQQQARANKQQGYKLTREQMQSVLTALRDENGKLDPISISLFVSTLNEKINKEQTIDSAFWRNVAQGASDFLTDTSDFAVREYNHLLATTGTYLGTDGEYHIATPEQITQAKEWLATYGSKEIETLRAGLNSVQQKAFEAAPDSSWIDAVITGTGSIIGQEAIPLAAGTIGGLGGIIGGAAVGAVTRYPSIASRNISQAYADNKPNAHAYALIASAPESSIESLFNAAAASSPIKKGLEYLGTKALSVPLLAQTAGVIQSSALLRYTSASLLEGVGELFIEDPAATLTNAAIFRSINKMAGRNIFAAPGWSDVQKAIASNTDNPRQAASIVAYSFLLGAFGIGADAAKAHQFALNRDQLLDAGFSQTAATEISRKAENISAKLGEIDRNPELSITKKLQQKQDILQNFSDWQKDKLNSDILNAKFEDLQKRYKANNLAFMDKAEATLAIETGAADAILKADGIVKSEISPTGNRILTLTYQEKNAAGANEIKTETIELNPTQYLNYIAARTSQQQRAAITSYQNALLGNAAVRKARTTSDITHDLINLKDLAPVSEAYAHIARKGAIDYQGAQLIAKAVAAKRNELINSGMTLQQANASADTATGATLGSLATIADAFRNRVETAAETSEGQAKGITTADDAESIAMRLPSAKSIGDSIVLYSEGEITLAELTEELVESDLEKAIANGTPLNTIRDNLLHVQTQLRQYNDNIKLFPTKDKEKLTRQDIIEAYSTLQAIDLIHRADRLPLTPTAKTIIKYALGQSELARATRVLGDAWATYANSKDGQAYLTTTGKTLSDLLDTAGISQSKLYSDLRVAEEDRIAVEAAQNFNPISALEQEKKDLDTAAAEADTAATTNTEAGLPRTEIPAEESATGEPIAVDPLETADNDPTTGEYNPSPLDETGTDPAFNGITSKSPFGITTGMMPPSNLKPHPALAHTPQVAAADFSPQYNPNAKPILALRMPDGSNLIVAGRTRQQIALADKDCKAVKVTLIDYDPAIHTDDWVQMTNAGEHIINRTATTEHFRTYFTLNPITHAQAIEQGLVPIDPKTGQPTAAYIKGRQEAEKILAAKAEADAAAAKAAAEEAKAKAEKQLPGQTKWVTPSKKSKPLSDSETKQTLISVAGMTVSKDGTRYVLGFVSTQRSKGTEYTVATDGRRLTVISQSTYKEDTDTETHEFYDSKGVQYKKDRTSQAYPNWRQVVPDTNKQQASTTIDLSHYSFLAKGSVKNFDRDPQSPSKKDKIKRIATPLFQDGQNIVFNVDGHRAHINPIFMRDLYKQMQELGKKLGFPPTLKVHYFDKEAPLVFTAEHNGITFQSIIMPLQDPVKNEQGYHQKDERGRWLYEPPAIKPGDIILGEQPSIYGEEHTASNTATLSIKTAKAKALFQDGVMQTANAIVTEPSFSIKALHASPHKFRKFSTEAMGTGEGAQAYGWGLYFSENLLVNRAYFKQFADLNKEPGILLNGKRMRRAEVLNYFSEQLREIDSRYSVAKAKEQMSYVLSDVSIIGGGMKGFLERAEKAVNRYSEKLKRNAFGYSEYGLETVKIMRDVAQLLAEHDIQPTHPFRTAINYRVELNVDDSNLLLWDKPVSDELFKAVDAATNNSLSEVGLKTARGKAIYETLEGYFESQQEASEWLAAHGYKGIKYLDGNSRNGDSNPTYNYVIFSGDDIKITAVNETGVWSMDEGWQNYTDPTATFSLRRRVDRNINSLLNEKETTLARVSNFIRKEAARTEKIMGGDTELQRAGVHFAQANAILNALDVHIFSKDLIRKNTAEYRKLRDLRSFISEYITVARKGKLPVKRNTKYGTPKQAIRKQLEEALNAELSSITESIAASGAGITAEQKKKLRELLISKLANENATIVLSAMLETAGDIIDTHLRNSIIDRMETSLRKMQPQLTPSRKFKRNTVDAETQHRLNLALRYLTLNKADRSTLELAFEPELISAELQKLENALANPNTTREAILKNMPHGIVRQAYEHIISQGGEPTIERVEDEISSMENAFNTYAYLRESTLNDTMRAFLALNNAVYNARFDWELKTEQRRAQDRAYIADAILNIPAEKATQNYQANNKTKLARQLGEVLQDNLMSASQVFEALRGVSGYEQLATETVNRIANSSIAISLREREIDLSLVESWLRIFKPDTYAKLPQNTNARNRELRKWENTDYTYFQSDCNQIVETDIILTPELTKTAKTIMQERGITAEEGNKLALTKGEMLDILLTAEQPHYESNLRAAGYTEEVLAQMRAIVGEELMNYGYAMRDLLLNSGVAEVYQERTGHALPDNPYYWPGTVAYTSAKQEAQPDQSTFAAAPQSSFLKKRVKSMHELRPQNAFAKFRSNMAARNNYIYAQPIVDQWNRLLRNPDFANRLKGVVGDSLVSTVKKALDVLANAAWGDTIMTDTHTRFFAAIQSGHAISVLAGKFSTLLKQLSALNHVGIFAKSGSGLLEWTKAIMRTLHMAPGHNVIGIGEMLETPAFRARWQNNAEYNHFLRMGRGASWGKIRQACKGLANLGMSAIAGMDIAANALSACVLYNANYNYYTKQNNSLPESTRRTDTEIRNQCMQDVNNMLELAAQPLRQSQKALLLATTNNLIVKGTFYMSTEVVSKLGLAQARSLQTYHKTGSSWKALLSRVAVLSSVGLPASIIAMALYAANNGMPDDEDELLAWLLSGAAQGVTGMSMLGNMPVIGPTLSNLFNAHAYQTQQWSQLVPDAVKIEKHFTDLYSMLKTSNSWTNAELAKTSNACLRDIAFITNGAATCTRSIPYLGTTLSVTANALLSLAAASNTTLIPTAAADTISGNKTIPDSKNSTRKKAHKQSVMEKLITDTIADEDYEKRKAAAKRERSRHTRRENRKKKAAERKANQQQQTD